MPLNLNELFTKIDEFVTEARNGTADAATKAADVTQKLTDWLREQANSLRVANAIQSDLAVEPAVEAQFAACCAKLEAFVAEPAVALAAPGAPGVAGGLPWQGIGQFILQLLQVIGPFIKR